MKFTCRKFLLLFIFLIVTVSSTFADSKGTIRVLYVDWAETVMGTNIYAEVLREQGYDVQLTQVSLAMIYQAIASGKADITLAAWLPNTQKEQYEKVMDKVEKLPPWYRGAKIGFGVPKYMEDVDCIYEIAKMGNRFKNTIVGIDPGAGIMKLTQNAIKAYNMTNYKLQSSSEAAMLAAVKNALRKKEPIVFTIWQPHWAFAALDIKMIEDPKGVFGGGDNIYKLARKDFGASYPEVYNISKNFELNATTLNDLLYQVGHSSEKVDVIARNWVLSHKDIVAKWTQPPSDK